MSYCALGDIQALIPVALWDSDGDSPQPSTSDVGDWIGQADAEIDSKLVDRYQIPITGAESLKIIRSISAALVAERIWAVVFTGQVGAPDVPRHIKDMRDLLDDLALGKASLSDAASLGAASAGAPGAPSMTMRPLREDPQQTEEADPIFSPGQVW